MNNVQAQQVREELTKAGKSPDAFVAFTENGAKFNDNGKETEVELDHERIADTNPEWERPIATARALVKALDGDKSFARKSEDKQPVSKSDAKRIEAQREGQAAKAGKAGTKADETELNGSDETGKGDNVVAQPKGANTPKA